MNTERKTGLALAGLLLLGGCTDHLASMGTPPAAFGEANRQTMLAQTVDPEPVYDSAQPATSARHAAQAAERYGADRVKQPERISSTESASSGSSR